MRTWRWWTYLSCMAALSAGLCDISLSTARMVAACICVCSHTDAATASRSPRSDPVRGGTADSRVPSMKAASTRSAFDGQRRYIVALLALASVATASMVSRS